MAAPSSRSARRSISQRRVELSLSVASAIPRFAHGLVAVDAHTARPGQQAGNGLASIALLDAGAEFGDVALAKFGDGGMCGDALLDRIESPGIVSLALRRQQVASAVEAGLKTAGAKLDAAAIGGVALGATGHQWCGS